MTRTVFFGKPTLEQKRLYETVLNAQQKAIDLLSSPSKSSLIDKTAREYITLKGYPTIPHSLGHGIGLEVHEAPHLSPKSKDILKEGMVFSIEPGIYITGSGGVRIEDLVVLTKSGPKLLTHSPKTLIIL
jgi:Xaa-Pro aminopeptidase